MAVYLYSGLLVALYFLIGDFVKAFGLSLLCWIAKDMAVYLIGKNEEIAIKKLFDDFKRKHGIGYTVNKSDDNMNK